jgi:aryl-alcohol dehydrogenase-like predicted oxidoreductase
MRPAFIPWFNEENLDANLKLVGQFKELADKKGCLPSQLSVAWLLKQGEDILPIPGTKRIKYLEQNWASLNVRLTDEDEAEIRKFVESANLAGSRSVESIGSYALGETKEE